MQLDILQKKNELLSQVYLLTKNTVFTGGDEDAVRYAELMENRERLFNEIKTLDDKLSDAEPCKEAERALAGIKKTTGDI